MGGAVDNTALANQLGITTDTEPLTNLLGQQNAATQILSDLTTQDTNPFLATQLENAIGGAVDKVSSQYALGGRLGSDSFAGALGAGITGAAAPILSQKLYKRDRANQLAAAQALGQVSGQENQQQLNLANSLLGAQQTDLSRDATLANQLTAASEADARARLAAITAAPGLLGADQALISQAAQLGGLARGVDQAALDATAAQAAQSNVLDQTRSMPYSALLAWVRFVWTNNNANWWWVKCLKSRFRWCISWRWFGKYNRFCCVYPSNGCVRWRRFRLTWSFI